MIRPTKIQVLLINWWPYVRSRTSSCDRCLTKHPIRESLRLFPQDETQVYPQAQRSLNKERLGSSKEEPSFTTIPLYDDFCSCPLLRWRGNPELVISFESCLWSNNRPAVSEWNLSWVYFWTCINALISFVLVVGIMRLKHILRSFRQLLSVWMKWTSLITARIPTLAFSPWSNGLVEFIGSTNPSPRVYKAKPLPEGNWRVSCN